MSPGRTRWRPPRSAPACPVSSMSARSPRAASTTADRGPAADAAGRARARPRRLRGRPRGGALQPDRRGPRRLRRDPARLSRSAAPSTRRCRRAVGYTTLSLEVKMVRPITREVELVRAEGEVIYRGRRPGDRPGAAHRRGDRQAARPRHDHLHDPRVTREGDFVQSRRFRPLAGRPAASAAQAQEEADSEAARAVADVGAAAAPGRPGDVEVHPRDVVGELLEERAGVDRPRLPLRGRVREVGDRPLRQLLVLRVQRQPPDELAAGAAASSIAAAHSSSLEISAA